MARAGTTRLRFTGIPPTGRLTGIMVRPTATTPAITPWVHITVIVAGITAVGLMALMAVGAVTDLTVAWGYAGRTTITIESPTVNYSQGYGSAWEGPLQTTPGDPTQMGEKSLDKFLPKKKVDGTEKFVHTAGDAADGQPKVSAASLYAGATISSNRFSGPDGEVYQREDESWSQHGDGGWTTMQAIAQEQPVETRPQQRPETQAQQGWVPAHKKTLSRSELDRQELARLEGMDQYSKYIMAKDSRQQ